MQFQDASNEQYPLLKNTLKRFSWTLMILLSILLSIGYGLYTSYQASLEKHLLAKEDAFIESTTSLLKKEMHEQCVLLEMIVNSKALSDFLKTHSDKDRIALEDSFKNLTQTFQYFGQVRLFDSSGIETIRVNYDGARSYVVPKSDLQNKYDRYYIQQGLKLKPGEIFVSRLDLNREHGKIEYPYKPVLRFVTPVTNTQGKAVGLIILNYLPSNILNTFRKQMKLRLSGQGMLINTNGSWVSNDDRSNEWGKSLNKPNNTFQNIYPNAWETIRNGEHGTLKTSKGLFRYQAISPFNFDENNLSHNHLLHVTSQSKINTNWKLVIFLSNKTINANSFFYKASGQIILAIIVISLSSILLLLAYLSSLRKKQYLYDTQINKELSSLYEDAPCGYHSLDQQGYITRINKTELDWLGYSKDNLIGQHFTMLLTKDSAQKFNQFIAQHNQNEVVDNLVIEILCKDGRTFFASIIAKIVIEQGLSIISHHSVFNISDRIKLEKKLEFIANTDVLTGISNRRHFFELANVILEKSVSDKTSVSLLMLDIDHFKSINDQYGHDIGDIVLRQMAQLVAKNIDSNTIFARMGGEEFVLFASGLTYQQSLQLAEKIRLIIQNETITINDTTVIHFSTSIGVTVCKQSLTPIDQLLKRADTALYKAKAQGRNRVVMHTLD